MIKSPGIPDKAPIVKRVKERQIPVISEIEFAGRYTDAKIIGITGSNGKTTTTSLTYHILKNAGLNVGLAGNIGKSFAYQVATRTSMICMYWNSAVLCWMICMNFKTDIAVLLNITPDHLDRYDYKFEELRSLKVPHYCKIKQEADYFIYCADDAETIKSNSRNAKLDTAIY